MGFLCLCRHLLQLQKVPENGIKRYVYFGVKHPGKICIQGVFKKFATKQNKQKKLCMVSNKTQGSLRLALATTACPPPMPPTQESVFQTGSGCLAPFLVSAALCVLAIINSSGPASFPRGTSCHPLLQPKVQLPVLEDSNSGLHAGGRGKGEEPHHPGKSLFLSFFPLVTMPFCVRIYLPAPQPAVFLAIFWGTLRRPLL